MQRATVMERKVKPWVGAPPQRHVVEVVLQVVADGLDVGCVGAVRGRIAAIASLPDGQAAHDTPYEATQPLRRDRSTPAAPDLQV